jgi:hypothetical protein
MLISVILVGSNLLLLLQLSHWLLTTSESFFLCVAGTGCPGGWGEDGGSRSDDNENNLGLFRFVLFTCHEQ